MGLSLEAWASPKRWAVAGPKASLIPAWAAEQACSKDRAVASSMVQAVSKDLAVASSKAQAACSKDLVVATSMVRAWAQQACSKDLAACSKDLAAATSMVHAWAQQACPKELSVASSMVLQGAMACSRSKLASSKNRAHSWPTCFSAP